MHSLTVTLLKKSIMVPSIYADLPNKVCQSRQALDGLERAPHALYF